MRGGKRKGAGAPAGPRLKDSEKAKRINTTMKPDMIEFINKMKTEQGYSKAMTIDKALRLYRASLAC